MRVKVERALARNPNLAEAHNQMGRIKQQVDLDWAGADASIQRAIALEPGDPDAVRSGFLGRFEEALPLKRRAVDFDPRNADGPQDALSEIELVRVHPERAFLYPIVYYALGREKESDAACRESIAKFHAGNAYSIAGVYPFRNQCDQVFE